MISQCLEARGTGEPLVVKAQQCWWVTTIEAQWTSFLLDRLHLDTAKQVVGCLRHRTVES